MSDSNLERSRDFYKQVADENEAYVKELRDDLYVLLDEMDSFRRDQRLLLDALSKLANEAAGFLALSDIERHGMTNSRILRLRIEEARDVIAKIGSDL